MTERIGIRITELCSPIVPFNLSESEVENYPYAVYSYSPSPVMSKDGIYKYTSEVELKVTSDNFDEADNIVSELDAALKEIGDDFTYHLSEITPECTEGIWTIQMNIIVNQYR